MSKHKLGGNVLRWPTTPPAPTTRTYFADKLWLLALALILVTFVAYFPALRGGFIWDDDSHLTANPAMTAPHGLRMIWSSLRISRYYPLTLTTFWVQRRFWGLSPMPYHAVNIALHAINSILILLVLRRLRVRAAWLAAMLWALHPVNAESVAWITELKNTQSGVFFFLALLCFLRFDAQQRRCWYVLAVVCGLAAMLSKPSTTVLPLVLLLCVWWNRGRWQRTDIARIIPFFSLALAMSVLTVIEQRRHVLIAGTAEWQLGMGQRLVIAGKAIWFYAAKMLWPARLMFVYPRWEVDATSLWSWLPLAGLVGVGLMLWRYRSRPGPRAALFGCGFFVVALLPVLGFFNIYYFRYSFIANHFQYLANVGLVALAAGAGTALCDRAAPWGKHFGAVVASVLLVVLGLLTWKQACTYRDAQTVWQDTIAKNPQCWMAHNNLGVALREQGRQQEAIQHFEQALRIKPDLAEVHHGLAIALIGLGKVPEAIGHFERALQIRPDYVEVHYNLGAALMGQGRLQEAISHYEQALRIEPDSADAHCNLGVALMGQGRLQEAIGHYEQALRIEPDFAGAHCNLGVALQKLGRTSEAVQHYQQALRIEPDFAGAHFNLGLALEKLGRTKEAIGHYEQALRIKPDFTEAQNALARLQAGQ
jgi:tetratricopeptide (TPR) repeat protein